jgi:hypothetical protein
MSAGAWIALGSLALLVLSQTVAIAFLLGGLFARVKVLEERPADGDCKTELAVLTSKFAAMEKTLEAVASDMHELLSGSIIPAQRASAPR